MSLLRRAGRADDEPVPGPEPRPGADVASDGASAPGPVEPEGAPGEAPAAEPSEGPAPASATPDTDAAPADAQPAAPADTAPADTEGLAGLVAATGRGAAAEALPAPVTDAADTEPVPAARDDAAEPRTAGEADAAPAAHRSDHATTPEPAPRARLDLAFGPPDGPDPLGEGRPPALRVAGLHLRTGQHALARAELEALAGRGRLDEAALLDLAEVRWRTGDLPGAGEAANALLARGAEPLLALVIAAEAVAAAGRPGEARGLMARALEVAGGPLDPLFAGMPRAAVWPEPAPDAPAAKPRRPGRRSAAGADRAPSTAAEAFAGGRAALARGDASRAALLLSVAMRLEPDFAADVLRAVAGRDDQALLALVRGDALRMLGREPEALEAFQRARGRSSAAASRPAAGGPGLFDGDPAISPDDPA